MLDYYSFSKAYLSPRFLAGKVQEKGLYWCLRTGVKDYLITLTLKIYELIAKLIVTPVLRYPLYYMGVRFVNMPFWLIGHFASDPDCFVKEGILGMRPKFFELWLVYSKHPRKQVVNHCLLNYWRKRIRIITCPFLCAMLEPFSHDEKLEYRNVHEYTDKFITKLQVIQKAWGDRPPVLSLSELDRERGWSNLRRLGVPEDAWFVTVHCREPGFHQNLRPDYTDSYAYRDADIYTYIPAIRAIVERGGWCIRVGDPTMKPLPQMDNVIDYVHLDIKSDWMDIFLLASCKFHLGGSGVYNVCCAFGVPIAMPNRAPMATVLPYGPRDIGIPKLVWSNAEGRLLTFKELLSPPIDKVYVSHQYAEAGLSMVDNSPEDIRELALEMLDRIEGRAIYTAEDESLQERFKSLLKPGHESYGGSSRVGRDFLRKYAMLLPD